MEAALFHANPMRRDMWYRVIIRCGFCFIQATAPFLTSLFTGQKKHLSKGCKAWVSDSVDKR
jgi:hypothetical protein